MIYKLDTYKVELGFFGQGMAHWLLINNLQWLIFVYYLSLQLINNLSQQTISGKSVYNKITNIVSQYLFIVNPYIKIEIVSPYLIIVSTYKKIVSSYLIIVNTFIIIVSQYFNIVRKNLNIVRKYLNKKYKSNDYKNIANIVKIFYYLGNPQVTKALSTSLGTSENIRLLSKRNEWLAGLIDGVGCFKLSKKGYASLEITLSIRDSLCLYKIKDIYGGSIKIRSSSHSIRYRLHHKEGLISLINSVNGNIRNSNRMLQLIRITNHYNIRFIYPKPLTKDNGWVSGFFDSNGTIAINKNNSQLYISISHKTVDLLEPLVKLFNGYVYIDRSSNTFKYYVTKRTDILNLIEYFKAYPCFSEKKNRLYLVNNFYNLKALKHLPNYEKLKTHFFKKWEAYSD